MFNHLLSYFFKGRTIIQSNNLAKTQKCSFFVDFGNKITTNHSYFGRENEHFDFLQKVALPDLEKRRQKEAERRKQHERYMQALYSCYGRIIQPTDESTSDADDSSN